MYISYRRNVSAPNSSITSSGLITFLSDLDIFAVMRVTSAPVAVSTYTPSARSSTSSIGTSDLSARW